MRLERLRLRQFRGYDALDLAFGPGLNLLVGANGAGKSNLLEAVAVLATGDSHRGAEGKHLFPWEKDALFLSGDFDGEEPLLVEARQERGRPRYVKLNNATQKRLRDWVGRIPVVSFSPEDLDLVKGEPSGRRRCLNLLLAQALPGYADQFQRYAKVLEERNAALKAVQEGRSSPSSLEPWDLSLLREGALLTLARREGLADFGPRLTERHQVLSGGKENAVAAYKPSFNLPLSASSPAVSGDAAEVVAANRRRLQDLRPGEVATGSTLIGPHRDDVEFTLDGRPARAFASQGQQRTLSIAWKLAELLFLKEKSGREPLRLMDDLLSELDPARRAGLMALLADGGQSLVTLTALSDWAAFAGIPERARVFEVGDGRVLEKALKVESF